MSKSVRNTFNSVFVSTYVYHTATTVYVVAMGMGNYTGPQKTDNV